MDTSSGGGGGNGKKRAAATNSRPVHYSHHQPLAPPPKSVIELCGKHTSRCGYCKPHGSPQGRKTSVSYGMVARSLTCTDYQGLIDRGWRRSGTYLYKPIMHETCCPPYTIRLEASRFRPTKTQRNVQNRMLRYTGELTPPPPPSHTSPRQQPAPPEAHIMRRLQEALQEAVRVASQRADPPWDLSHFELSTIRVQRTSPHLGGPGSTASSNSSSNGVGGGGGGKKKEGGSGGPGFVLGDYSSPVALQLSSSFRRAGVKDVRPVEVANTLQAYLHLQPPVGVTVAPNGFLNISVPEGFAVATGFVPPLEQPQPVPMETDEGEEGQSEGDEQGHKLVVTTEVPRVTDEVFELYKKYQVAVHGDDPEEVTRDQFKRFLVVSPLITSPVSDDGSDPDRSYKVPYGSYHQLYRLDGKLIAVGVVDILPTCLSSVYCFYDPDFRHFSLGKLTALMEIKWVQQASRFRPDLRYYYLGFYIHNCQKMKYKGDYAPSELLCPETRQWAPMEECRAKLDTSPYSRLGSPAQPSGHGCERMDLAHVRMDVGPFSLLTERSQAILAPILMEYGSLVGPELAASMMLKFT